jgi:hypothetical protein
LVAATIKLCNNRSILTPNKNITVFSLSILSLFLSLLINFAEFARYQKHSGNQVQNHFNGKGRCDGVGFAGQLEYITTHQFFLSKEVFSREEKKDEGGKKDVNIYF